MFLVLFLAMPFMGWGDAAGDAAILQQLQKGYAACDRKRYANPAICRHQVYKDLALNYCRNSVTNCQKGLGLMNPKYCFYKDECKTLPSGEMQLSYVAKPGKECKAENQRAELTDAYLAKEGEAMEFSMDMTLPPANEISTESGSLLVAQYKASGGNSPPFALRYKKDGRLVATIRHNRAANGGISLVGTGEDANGHEVEQELFKKVNPGVPMKFTIQVQAGSPGFARVKVDGKVLWTYSGPMGYKDSPNYFKLGPYDHSCKQKTPIRIHYGNYQRSPMKEKIEAPGTEPETTKPADTTIEV